MAETNPFLWRSGRIGEWLLCAVVVWAVAGEGRAWADNQQTVYWRLQTNANPEVRERFIKALERVLGQAEEQHLLTEAQLARHIGQHTLQIPDCYESARGCESLPMHLIQALQVDGMVVAEFDAPSQTVTLRYWRSSGGTPKEIAKKGEDLQAVIRDSVSSLFTLEAVVHLESEPDGAKVYVNGNFIGQAPVSVRLGEGQHALRLELDGYEVLRDSVALSAAEERAVKLRLEPILTQLTVLTGAPNADVFVNDLFRARAGEPFDVIPGEHNMELRAPGYNPIGMVFKVAPAQRLTYRFAMLRTVEDPDLLRERRIEPYRLYVRPYYGLHFQNVGFTDNTFSVQGREFYPAAFDGASQLSTSQHGLGVAVGYTFGPWGLMLLDVSAAWSQFDGDVRLQSANSGETLSGSDAAFSRVSIRALQGTLRHFWGGLSVEGVTGLGVGFDTLSLNTPLGAAEFSNTNLFFSLAAHARYHWHEQWYLSLSYGLEVDFGGDRGLRHGMQAGIGFFLPWLTAHPPEASQEDAAPDELPTEPAPEIPGLIPSSDTPEDAP